MDLLNEEMAAIGQMPNTPAPLVNDRAELQLALNNLKRRGVITAWNVISPSVLRIKQALSNTASQYSFDIKTSSGVAPDEVKLNENDAFFCTHIGFYIVPQLEGATPDPLNIPYQTYPNTVAFANTGDPLDLEVIYKGRFNVQVQSTIVYEATDLQRFRYVPQTQQATAADKSEHVRLQGLMNLTPNLFINGRANNQITVTLPTQNGVQIEGTNDYVNYLVFQPIGFLVKNVSFSNVK